MSFTPAQLEFITEPNHCVALAGPGSGKTTSLVEKIVRLANTPGTKIIAATFTRDAADEMTMRLAKRVPQKMLESGRIQVNTWHSLTLDHRKRNHLSRRVLSPAHQFHLAKRIIAAYICADDRVKALHRFEEIKCSLLSNFNEIEEEWFHHYQRELDTLNAIDLYDAIRDTALQIGTKALPAFDATHLIVDETQDNDEVQFHLADLHARLGMITSMVGDDDQTVYEWRRARGYEGMKEFSERHHAKIISLGDNFRSLSAVIDASNRLISNNKGFRLPKTFVSRRGAGGTVQIHSSGEVDTTSESIVDGISKWAHEVASSGLVRYQVPTGSVAILARNNYLLDAAEASLIEAQIKYVRSGGSVWESEPADLLMTLLATFYTADSRGLDVALQIAGLPTATISAVNVRFRDNVMGFIGGESAPGDFGGQTQDVELIAKRLATLYAKARNNEIASLIGSTAAFVKQIYPENSLYDARMRKILRAVASGLIALRGPVLARLKQARAKEGRIDASNTVVLQTFHGCKGMEFTNVFLLGVDQDTIPGRSEIRAERRLLYVACTRAKDNLIITYTPGKGSMYLSELE